MEKETLSWSLEELYTSFESGEWKEDFEKAHEDIRRLKSFCERLDNKNENLSEIIRGYITVLTEFSNTVSKLYDFCQLTLSVYADDKTAAKYLDVLESAMTETAAPETKFRQFLKEIGSDKLNEILANEGVGISEYAFYLQEAMLIARYTLSEAEENVIAKMEHTGSSAWIRFQNNIMATLTADVTIDGEKKSVPFSEVRNMALNKKEHVRKAAYEAELAACEKVSKTCAAALNAIKGEALTVCALRGYESPLHMTVIQSRMDMDVLNALISSMRKNIGIFSPYFTKKAEILGKNALPFYDLFAPIGSADFSFSFQEAVDYVCEKFEHFSQSLAKYARNAALKRWIDPYPREGKSGGAFCQNMHYLKESRFLLNFDGSYNDVLTLAHELGHGYHGDCLKNEAYVNSSYPMPIAECASSFCETIVINAALKNAQKNEAQEILENSISGSAQVIVDILSRFMFESEIFERRKSGPLTPEEMCAIMASAQKKTYGVSLDPGFLHKYMWVVKSHYYSASVNFYNFPYAFGLLLAKGLYSLFLEKGNAFSEIYVKMLASTGKASLRDVCLVAGADIGSETFWDSGFAVIKGEIDMFLSSF